MNPLVKLRETTFSATQQRIADYILQHASKLQEITISTVAKECETSKSMVVQLCKTAGFSGYKDLCRQLMVEQALSEQQDDLTAYDDIHPNCSLSEIARITLREEMRSLQDTADLMDFEAMEQAVQLLMGAKRIELFGVGGSAVAALDLHNKLCRIGLNAHFSQDVHCQLLETAGLTCESVAVVISFNGRTKDMIEVCELAKEMEAKIISITRFGASPVASLSDVNLAVASNESLCRVTSMSSRLSTLSMVDVLFACLASRMSDRIAHIVERNTRIASRRRK